MLTFLELCEWGDKGFQKNKVIATYFKEPNIVLALGVGRVANLVKESFTSVEVGLSKGVSFGVEVNWMSEAVLGGSFVRLAANFPSSTVSMENSSCPGLYSVDS